MILAWSKKRKEKEKRKKAINSYYYYDSNYSQINTYNETLVQAL